LILEFQVLANPGKVKFLDEVEEIEKEAKLLKGMIQPIICELVFFIRGLVFFADLEFKWWGVIFTDHAIA
jgi:hypothetical protein